jgi:mannose-6-phosphate isomerase-like protein (cupin superfamily)
VTGGARPGRPAPGRVVTDFATRRLPRARDVVAPDGSDVRVLLGLRDGGLAHFELAAGQTSIPVAHRTVDEIWFFVSGRGEMWRKQTGREELVSVEPGICVTIPRGTRFQFRSTGDEALAAVAVTMPPWPGEGEAFEVDGTWTPTVQRPSAPPSSPS